MKKTLITGAIALSALSFAFAEDGAERQMAPRPMQGKAAAGIAASGTRPMPQVTTGSSTVDMQIKALRQEMEAKIKAIQDEYNTKIKALIGDNRAMLVMPNGATTTVPDGRHEINDTRREQKDAEREVRQREREDERATSSQPFSGLGNFFRGFFGLGGR